MLKKALFFSTACIIAQHAAHAQSIPVDDSTDSDDSTAIIRSADSIKKVNELQSVEIRSVRAAANAPFAKTELTKVEIAKNNLGQDLPILLQNTPSAVVSSDAGTGVGYTGIRIRGTDGTRINVTFNGMPVNDPESHGTFYVNFPDLASSTNSIQIQRGVGTSTNGAGAFGATVSISNLGQLDSAGCTISSSFGSFNTLKNTVSAGTGMLKGGFQFDVRLSAIKSDGYIQRSASDLKALQFVAGWTPNKNTSFKFLFMPGSEKTGQAWNGVPLDSLKTNRTYNELGMKEDGTFYNNQTDNYAQTYYQLFADHKFSPYISGHVGIFLTRGLGYYEEYKTDQSYSSYYLPSPVYGTDTVSSTSLIRRLYLDNYYYGTTYSLQYSKNKTNIMLGGGWNQFQNLGYGKVIWAGNGGVSEGYKWYQHDAQKNDLNVYAKAEHSIGRLTLFGDMQYRNVAYFMNGFRKNPTLRHNVNFDFFNPKAGINYKIGNSYRYAQRAYASVAVANREPNRDAFETAATLPKSEHLTDYEAGYEINSSKWAASANLYYMDYFNQLVLTGQINDVGAYTQTNVKNSYRAGLELQGSYIPCRFFRVLGNVTFSQNKIKDAKEYIDNYDSTGQRLVMHGTKDIAFSPNIVSSLTIGSTLLDGKHGQLNIDVSGKYVGDQYLDNTSDNNRKLDAFKYVNVLIRYGIAVKPFKEVVASLALNNIFGEAYSNNGYTYSYIYGGSTTTVNYYYPQAKFNMLAGITLKF